VFSSIVRPFGENVEKSIEKLTFMCVYVFIFGREIVCHEPLVLMVYSHCMETVYKAFNIFQVDQYFTMYRRYFLLKFEQFS